MDNTVSHDSNSESDISDSWALIDEDSALEWNNEAGLCPQEFILKKSDMHGRPTNSRTDSSDDDSIEIVEDDQTECMCDTEVEEVKSQPTELSSLKNTVELSDSVDNCENAGASVSSAQFQPKKYAEFISPFMITVLIIGICGGFVCGFSLGSYIHTPESSQSIENTRESLAKLKSENLFLHHQLHSAQSSVKTAATNFLKTQCFINFNAYKTVYSSFNASNTEVCTIRDHLLQSNFNNGGLNNMCIATKMPQNENDDLIVHNNLNSDRSTSGGAVLLNIDTETNVSNIITKLNEVGAVSLQKTNSNSTLQHKKVIINSNLNEKNRPENQTFINGEILVDRISSENQTEPKPFTKLRSMVENIFTIAYVFGNNIQKEFPSKSVVLSILPENMVDLNFSVDLFSSDYYRNIADFKDQLNKRANKVFGDIENSINRLLTNMAHKLNKFDAFYKKQICKLREKLENSPQKDLIDWNKTIFQKCLDYKQNEQTDSLKTKSDMKLSDQVLKDKIKDTNNLNADFNNKVKERHMIKKEYKYMPNKQKVYLQQTQNINKNNYVKERPEFVHSSSDHVTNENSKHNKLSEIHGRKIFSTRTKEGSDKNMEQRKDKGGKIDGKRSNCLEDNCNWKKSYGKKKFGSRNDHENVQDGKFVVQEDVNISGQWTENVAHGRAEQGRHEHQSYWVFGRAESRKLSRDKDSKESAWVFDTAESRKSITKQHNKDSDWIFDRAESRKSSRKRDSKVNGWVFDRAESRKLSRKRDSKVSGWVFDRAESRKLSREKDNNGNLWCEIDAVSSDTCNKTKSFKNHASKMWKNMKHQVKENVWRPIVDTANKAKHQVKENVWRPIVDTANTAKRLFNNYKNCHSQPE